VQPIIAILVLWVFWILTWLAAVMGARQEAGKLTALQNVFYRVAVFLGFLLLCSFTPWPGLDVKYGLWRTLSSTAGWLMVLAAFAAFAFAWWARIQRGLHWASVERRSEAFHVVETGPYAVVRQPVFLGLIVAAFATAVVFGRPSSFCGAFVLSVAFIAKALIEEHMLRGELLAYDDYAEQVPMLLPIPRRRRAAKAEVRHPSLRDAVKPPAAAPVKTEPSREQKLPQRTAEKLPEPAPLAPPKAPAGAQLSLQLDGALPEAKTQPQPALSEAMSITKR
jgi:protein-S-isoprenylcysteine O-methyltransferase Ste14